MAQERNGVMNNIKPDAVKPDVQATPSTPVPVSVPEEFRKEFFRLQERVLILEAKTANMSLAHPVTVSGNSNHNTDTVAGMP